MAPTTYLCLGIILCGFVIFGYGFFNAVLRDGDRKKYFIFMSTGETLVYAGATVIAINYLFNRLLLFIINR